MNDTNPLLTAALDYAARGWRVIPLYYVSSITGACSCKKGIHCESAGKHPKDMGWQRAEPLSVPDIHATWGDDVRWKPNLGLAVGDASGFWVLDIDPKNGGMETMAALVAEHGAMPATFVIRTGSGGYHYYFALPEGVDLRNSADRVGKGIDTRANGGQVVAAPSVTNIGPYEVVSDAPIGQAPAWLIEAARKADVDPSTQVTAEDLPRPEDIDEAEWRRLSAYAQRAIDGELKRLDALKAEGWNGAPWNHTTFQVACSLLEFANSPWCSYSVGQAEHDVMTRTPRDGEGFDDFTVRKTWDSARERIGNQARPMPADRRPAEAGPDPLFSGPDVRKRNPSEGAGAQGNPDVGKPPYREFFGGEKGNTPLHKEMALGVFDRGPVGWGRDLDFWSYDGGVWKSDHYVVQHRLVDMLGNAYKTGHRSNVCDVVQRHAQPITGDPLEHLMNFRNGMLDWREGELGEHDPSYGSTVQLGTVWDPDATCPTFDAFLAQVMHEDYIALAWEMLGYLMMSGNPREASFLFFGHGGNGKSTLIDLISRLLGKDNVASESLDDLNGNRFRTASLFGKIANLAGDIDATYQENTASFKRITGEDMITAEHKNMPPFKFQSWAVPVFSANKFPGSADLTEGYFRRWIVLHFHKRIPKDQIVDRGVLMERLEAELPGIAAKAVRALRVLDQRGHFEPTGEAVKGKEMYMLEIDVVRQWLASADVTAKPEGWTNLVTLYQAYNAWAQRAGHRNPVREQEFQSRLENVGLQTRTLAGMTEVAGISATVPTAIHRTPDNFF